MHSLDARIVKREASIRERWSSRGGEEGSCCCCSVIGVDVVVCRLDVSDDGCDRDVDVGSEGGKRE